MKTQKTEQKVVKQVGMKAVKTGIKAGMKLPQQRMKLPT